MDNNNNDGLQELQQRMHQQRTGKYDGFGSDQPQQYTSSNNNNNNNNVVEPLHNEDPNGIAPLAGESDQQYMKRQTRIRDEAKARMASKFENQKSMQGVGVVSDSTANPLNNNNNNKCSSSSMTSATSNIQ